MGYTSEYAQGAMKKVIDDCKKKQGNIKPSDLNKPSKPDKDDGTRRDRKDDKQYGI